MRLDGEPWLQPLPSVESKTIVEITPLRQAVMLTTGDCNAKCIEHQAGNVESTSVSLCAPASNISCSPTAVDAIDSGDEESDTECSEGKKFGAALTFKSIFFNTKAT